MKRLFFAVISVILALAIFGCSSTTSNTQLQEQEQNQEQSDTQQPITQDQPSADEKWAILEEAYIYSFPLVLIDATKTSATNTEYPDHAGHAPINQLIHAAGLASAETKVVVTPNVDTLYTQAWLNLSAEPMVYRMPSSDKFFNVQVLDAWTNTVTVLKEAGDYAFVLKGQQAEIPEGITAVEVPTSTVWLICRMVVDNPEDLTYVRGLQNAMRLVPLEAYASIDTYEAPKGSFDENNRYVPVQKVLSMSPSEYFNTANALMVNNPPAEADAGLVKKLNTIGVGADLTFSGDIFGEDLGEKWKTMLGGMRKRLVEETAHFSVKMNNWSYYGKPIGDFGTEYSYRTLIALGGLGANTNDIAIYPKIDHATNGEVLTGDKTYVLHLNKVPPVMENGFWSFTAYGEDDFLIDNPLNRYCINDRSNCKYNEDGSLDIILSVNEPEGNTDNWLPINEGVYHLYLRIYYPDMEAFDSWEAPTITAID